MSPLRLQRLKRNLRLIDVSVQTGISMTRLSLIERNLQVISQQDQESLARVLRVPAAALLEQEQEAGDA